MTIRIIEACHTISESGVSIKSISYPSCSAQGKNLREACDNMKIALTTFLDKKDTTVVHVAPNATVKTEQVSNQIFNSIS